MRRFITDFISIPKKIYLDIPQWIPWFDVDMRKILRRKHPFFLHSEGEFFIAYRDGVPVGRICVVSNRRYQEQHSRNCAHFFFLDAPDDRELFSVLIDSAADWAVARGCDLLDGPMLFGGAYGSGLLIEGFEHPSPMTMMPYNFPYYAGHIESRGFVKYFDVFCAGIGREDFKIPEKVQNLADTVLRRGRFKVLKFNSKKELRAIAPEVGRLYNITLADHPEDYPLSDEELKQLTDDLIIAAEPDLIKVLSYDDRIVGFLLAFSDAGPALRKNFGRLTPLCLIRLVLGLRTAEKVLFNGIGILPGYQRIGGNALLYSELASTVRDHGFRRAEFVHIAESTELMLSDMKTLGADIYKRNRIYSLRLSG